MIVFFKNTFCSPFDNASFGTFLIAQCDFWAFLSSKQNSVNKYFSRQPNTANLAISASSMSVNKVYNQTVYLFITTQCTYFAAAAFIFSASQSHQAGWMKLNLKWKIIESESNRIFILYVVNCLSCSSCSNC